MLDGQDIDEVFVCDDASTDSTLERARSIEDSRLRVIAGEANLGAGSNRNRVLPHIGRSGIVLFLDVDTKVLPGVDFRRLTDDSFSNPEAGVVGYPVLDQEGKPAEWNFGNLMNMYDEAHEWGVKRLFDDGHITEELYREYAPNISASMRHNEPTEPIQVGWVLEVCFAARAALLKDIGNFAEGVRYHEAHFLGKNALDRGYKVLFDPRQ